jgi:hypothetical protein
VFACISVYEFFFSTLVNIVIVLKQQLYNIAPWPLTTHPEH